MLLQPCRHFIKGIRTYRVTIPPGIICHLALIPKPVENWSLCKLFTGDPAVLKHPMEFPFSLDTTGNCSYDFQVIPVSCLELWETMWQIAGDSDLDLTIPNSDEINDRNIAYVIQLHFFLPDLLCFWTPR